MKKIHNIQCLRGIAALVVVLFHTSISQAGLCGHTTYLTTLFGNGWAGVDLFFVISGFVMVVVTSGKNGLPINALKFIFDRIGRIFPLYWSISMVVLALIVFYPEAFHNIGHPSVWRSFLLLPQKGQGPLLGQAWTLIYEMYFYYAFAIFLLLPERFWIVAIVSWATALTIAGLMLATGPSFPVLATMTDPICLEFVLGVLVGKVLVSGFRQYGTTTLLVGASALAIVALCTPRSHGSGSWNRVLEFGVPSALVVYGAVASEGQIRLPQWLARLGDCSYSLYLVHMLPIGAIAKVASNLPHDIRYVAGPFMPIAAIACGQVGYRLLELPAMRILKSVRIRLFGSGNDLGTQEVRVRFACIQTGTESATQ